MRYKKANKIMMIVVSLLLALVLMTTCILSGIYAKYVTKRAAQTEIVLKEFDITITIDYNAVIDTAIANGTITTTQRTDEDGQEVVGITLQGLKLTPGDDYWNAISIKMAGSADVPIKVKVTPTASFNNSTSKDAVNNFYVQGGVGGLTKGGAVMPYGFTFGIYDSEITKNNVNITYEQTSVVDPCLPTGIGAGIAAGMVEKVSDFTRSGDSRVIYKEFQAGIPISFTSKADGTTSDEIFFGFYWPIDYSGTYVHNDEDKTEEEITNDEYNEISTWLATNRNPILNLTYEIEVSQK